MSRNEPRKHHYIPQFILRIIYFMPTFGIILKLANQGQNPELYKVLVIICAILEILRLIATIFVLIKTKVKKWRIIWQNVNNEGPRRNKHSYSKEYFLL